MWIAIRLPRLPLEIFLRGSSTPEPFALEERHRVFACDRKAFARGVRAGMAVAAALALAPALRIAPRDPATETEALLGVAGWAAQFTPGVALEFPDGVLLEVSSSLKLFGGLESLLERLRRGLAEMGWSSVLAGAPTPRAAFWLARAGKQEFIGESAELEPALAALPLEVLRCSDETLAAFEAIGVRTLGELRALPREGVARRFGQRLLDDSDRALGRLPGSNLGLALEQGKPPGQWEHLVERLRARLGTEAVCGIASRAEHRPERAGVIADAGQKRLQLDFGERPFWLLESPRPLAEIGAVPHHDGPLELLVGPERIESGWWDGDDVARDYFVARMQNEALVWIYREWRGEGGWYLHGVFA